MSIGINDTFTFGKHKGKTFADVVINDPGYCCWLREEKRKGGQPRAFDTDANKMVDQAILLHKSLQKKYLVWNATDADVATVIKEQVAAQEQKTAAQEEATKSRKLAYSDEWGAW